jgi:hypothetical protein
MIKLLLGVLSLLILPAHGAALFGTKSIGPSGNYTTIGSAISAIQANGLSGPLILELQPAYVSNVETFPLTFTNLGTTLTNTVTLRPQTGASGLVITSANTTTATVDLNGAQFVTIDGRPGGLGTGKQLSIANTSTSGRALRFINEASNNTVQYAILQGVNTSSSSGVVVFSTTTGANGNDNNTIDHCDIRDGASTPASTLYALGTTTTTAQNNSGNTISNCNIFNFYSSSVDAAGARIEGGNTDWALTGNSFYQTTSRAAVNFAVQGIHINNTSGNNFAIHGNFVGGSAPSAGGAAWTTSGTLASYIFQGIRVAAGTTTPSSIQGNVVANIVWTSAGAPPSLPSLWCGIYVSAGNVNIGTVTGNTIGRGTGSGSVTITTSGANNYSFGIGSGSAGMVAIAGNTVGSMTVNGTASTASASIVGIQVNAGTNTITNNVIGNATVPSPLTSNANSLNSTNPSTSSTTDQEVMGIVSNSTTSTVITGNLIANLNNNAILTGRFGKVWGISTTAGVNTITGNTVRNLTTTSQNIGTDYLQAVSGIIDRSSAAGQTISQNTVHSLANTAATGAVRVSGIYFTGPSSGANVIERNLVHSLEAASTSASSEVAGISVNYALVTVRNNMVRVGLRADGASTAGASNVYGLLDGNSYKNRSYFHNSVYLGGAQTSGASNTYALASLDTQGVRVYQNNILVNARSNSGATGKHYAVAYNGVGTAPTGLTSGGNIFLTSGFGGVLGSYSGDKSTLAAWQVGNGQDATSFIANPFFVAPTGDAVTVDLHLRSDNPSEGAGIAVATVTDDFDGQERSTLTPHDIGADAGTFNSLEGVAPTISIPVLSNATTANRVLSGWADIQDNSGTVAGGANGPRLYFKRSTDADVFGVSNDATGNGWKYVTATGGGPYSFTLDYSLIYGGSVSVGDTVQYFVVAQDAANNLASSPAGAIAAADPPVQNLTSRGGVNSFSIVSNGISGMVTVGNGGTYPSLSGAGGFFAALNAAVLTGDVTVQVSSDLTETGSVILNQSPYNDYPQPTVTLQPDNAVMRTISGTVAGALVTLNGADRVIFDGRFGGGGRYLTLRNTSTSTSARTILFINDACGNTISNCIVEGASTSTSLGVIAFSTGTVTGNDGNLVTGCQVRDLSTSTGVPRNLVGSTGSSASVSNSFNIISNNEIFNFNSFGILAASTGNDSWTVSGNNVYEINAATNNTVGINMFGAGTHIITGNSVRDLVTTSTSSTGISYGGSGTATISRNRIAVFNLNAATTTVYGVLAQGSAGSTLNLANNQIILSPTGSTSATIYGISQFGSTPVAINVFYNSIVLGGTESGTQSSWGARRASASSLIARNNILLNLRTGGTGSHFAFGSVASGGSFAVSNNVYAGTGSTAADFMEFSMPVSFAAWQSSASDTDSQAGIAGSGSFTAAMFVDAANGDLHLVPGGSPLVNVTGIPIAEVGSDYDGDLRSLTTPSIGIDEAVVLTAIAGWRLQHFGITTNSGNAADDFDYDHDGLSNLIEWACHLNPTTPSTLMANAVLNGGNLEFTYTRSVLALNAGTSFAVEWSDTLANWQTSGITENILFDDGTVQQVKASIPTDSNGRRFVHLKVTAPP